MKTFKFLTNSIEFESKGLKGEREYYVKGYISTDEIDRANEVVTREAMKSMVEQIKAGSVKLDIEHSTFTGENDIPVGKILDAGIDENGVWVKCTLNKAHSRFNEYWKSIKDGFLDAFSIAYKPLEIAKDVINGTEITLLKAVELLNVAITGNPVCRTAKMTESFYKSLKYINEYKSEEDAKMTEEVKPTDAPVADVKEVKEEVKEEIKEEPKEEVKEEITEKPKEEVKEEPVKEEVKEEPKEEVKEVNPLDTIKSLQGDIAELKSSNDKLEAELKDLNSRIQKPVLKARANTEIKSEDIPAKKHNPLDMI